MPDTERPTSQSDDHLGAWTVSEQRVARGLCHHCAKAPELDGDHSCPCPYTDAECPNHPDVRPAHSDPKSQR